jgi:hypothetical protein
MDGALSEDVDAGTSSAGTKRVVAARATQQEEAGRLVAKVGVEPTRTQRFARF